MADLPSSSHDDFTFWESFVSRPRSPVACYLFSVIASILSLGLIVLFHRTGLESYPMTSFAMLAVIMSAAYGGLGPAVVSTLITALFIDFFFSEPYFMALDSISSFLRIIIYLISGFLVAALVEGLRKVKTLKDQRQKAEIEKRARENVLGIVSHDLRSPLASIKMNVDFILRGFSAEKLPPSTPKRLAGISESAQRMGRIIDDLQDAIKVEHGHFKLEKKTCDVREIVAAAVGDSTAAATDKSIQLMVKDEATRHQLNCDGGRMVQVLDNLLSNAIKFSPEGSEVMVQLSSRSQGFEINVIDHGPGLAPEVAARLFERFWQAEDTAHKGTGLGLFISKRIVELHGGELNVRSQLGTGSTFSILLPA
jgi:signal transduction histidine kinase